MCAWMKYAVIVKKLQGSVHHTSFSSINSKGLIRSRHHCMQLKSPHSPVLHVVMGQAVFIHDVVDIRPCSMGQENDRRNTSVGSDYIYISLIQVLQNDETI